MQIFEVYSLSDFPYMGMREVLSGKKISDIINESNMRKVYLLVDHQMKRIWTYNGKRSPFKLQIWGGILANLLRRQLKLFYRIYSLNKHSLEEEIFQDILEKELAPGRAEEVKKEDFPKFSDQNVQEIFSLDKGLNVKKAKEDLEELPKLEDFQKKFVILGANIFNEQKSLEKFVKEEKISTELKNIGQLNNGFNFFGDKNYSVRLLINNRRIQSIELYVNKIEKSEPLKLEIPVFRDQDFTRKRDLNLLIQAFQEPEKNVEE